MDNNNTYNKSDYEDLSLREAQNIMLDILKNVHDLCEKHDIKYFLDAGTLIGAARHKGFIPWDDDVDIGMLREDYNKFLQIAKNELSDHLFLQTFETDKYYNIYPTPCKVRCNNTLFLEAGVKEDYRMNNGVFIDVLPYDSLPKHRFIYKIQRIISFNILKSFKMLRDKPERLSFKNRITFSFYRVVVKVFTSKRRLKFFDYLTKWNDVNSEYMGYGVDTYWSQYIYKKKDYFELIKLEFEGQQFYAPKNYDTILTQLYGDYMTPPKEEDRVWHAKEMRKLRTND